MLKHLHPIALSWNRSFLIALGLALPSLLMPPALSLPAIDDSLVCYMQTPEGRMLNLNYLCGRNAGTATSQTAADSEPLRAARTPEDLPTGLQPYSSSANGTLCVALDQQGRPCPQGQ